MFTGWKREKQERIVLFGRNPAKPTADKQALAIVGVAALAIAVSLACGMDAKAAGLERRVVHFKVTETDIAEIEQGEAEGHQPWRSDPRKVAETALMSVEPAINPQSVGLIPRKRRIISPVRQTFRFELNQHHHIDQISVRRFHWRNPRTGKSQLTVWWAYEAVIWDSAKPAGK